MCAVRRHIRSLAANGNWRQVIDSLRPITPALWRRLETNERERFMRHLRPFWEVHRHRGFARDGCGDRSAAAIGMVASDGWPVARREGERWAGHRDRRGVAGTGLRASSAPARSSTARVPRPTSAGRAILCSMRSSIGARRDPIRWASASTWPKTARSLAEMATHHACSTTLAAGSRRDGEGTAVPELRVHAARLAATLLGTIPTPGPLIVRNRRRGQGK